ncbi:MAG: hypothetical protein Kow00114_16470 [Kiloniellaceae bacterium]
MDKRNRLATGVRLLRDYLHDDLVLARTLRERRWSDLLAAVEIANTEIDPSIAVTDPALYKTLRDAVTKFFLRGYGCLDVGLLRLKAEKEAKTPYRPAE